MQSPPSASELQRRVKVNRTAARLAKMKEAQALSDGKVWRNGRWADPAAISKGHALFVLRGLTMSERDLFMNTYGEKIIGGVTADIVTAWRTP
jgi:hypothetical protein